MAVKAFLWVALGSALGGMARHAVSVAGEHWLGRTFPFATLFINVAGSFLLGFLATMGTPEGRIFLQPDRRDFLLVGVLGGFTTFSTFSLQTLNLARNGQALEAGGYVILSVALSLAAVWLGWWTARFLSA